MGTPTRLLGVAFLLTVLASASAASATCLPGECCIEAGCCHATRVCQVGETCSCSFTCGQGQASCSCECSGGERVAGAAAPKPIRQDPDPKLATPLTGQEVGLTIQHGDISLDRAAAILQNTTRWSIRANDDVAACRVSGSFKGDLAGVVEAVAATCGAAVSVDSAAKSIVLGKR